MDGVTMTVDQLYKIILALCGGIVSVSAAIGVIMKLLSPRKALEKRVAKHDDLFAKDLVRLDMIDETNRHVCKALFALLDHTATGNSIDRVKKTRDALQDYLAGR